MSAYETLKTLNKEVGLVEVLEAVENLVMDFKTKHGYRRDFCNLSVEILGAISSEIRGFNEKYGYTAGKEA